MQSYVIAIGVALCALSAVAAKEQRIVRWEDTGPGSRATLRDGKIAKHLVVDQIAISASIVDREHGFEVRLEFTNTSSSPLDLSRALVELHAVRPSPAPIQLVAAATLADRVRKGGNGRAGAVEIQGFGAMTTRVETVPVVEVVPNPAALSDPTQPATIVKMGTSTEVKTVPDDAERMRTQNEGAAIRQRADKNARQIVERALTTRRVDPGSRAAGSVYYERDKAAQEVLVRIPLGHVTAEIPFTASRRLAIVGPRLVIFQ